MFRQFVENGFSAFGISVAGEDERQLPGRLWAADDSSFPEFQVFGRLATRSLLLEGVEPNLHRAVQVESCLQAVHRFSRGGLEHTGEGDEVVDGGRAFDAHAAGARTRGDDDAGGGLRE